MISARVCNWSLAGPLRRPAVVLVHGLGGNPGTWDLVAPALATGFR